MPDVLKPGIVKANNQGLVTTTGGNDLVHQLPIASTLNVTGARSAVITKIMAYNNTGANVTLRFGTLDRGVPTFVQLLPTLVAINALDTEWQSGEIPAVEFISWPQATAAGRLGDIYVVASAAAVQIVLEVVEYGA